MMKVIHARERIERSLIGQFKEHQTKLEELLLRINELENQVSKLKESSNEISTDTNT